MSKMTSSTIPTTSSTAASATIHNTTATTIKKPAKMLTDFSIETIMAEPMRQHQQQPNQRQQQQQVEVTMDDSSSCESTNQHHLTNQQRKSRPKNFQCPACKMAFSNNGQLKNHVRIHTGERPFICNHQDCNKTFTRNEELTRHKLIHTGVRPHACTSCGKRFGRKDHLKKHVRTHERKKLRKKMFIPKAIPIQSNSHFVPPKTSIATDSVATTSVASTPATAATAIQQLASDYWYNLLGFYQHHYQPPLGASMIDRLTRFPL